MARTKAVLGAGARLSDYLSANLLARVYPSDLVHQALNEHGVNSQRVRSFPAVAATYYCMALSLYPEAAYEDVFAVVAQGLAWMQGSAAVPTLAKSSISAARGLPELGGGHGGSSKGDGLDCGSGCGSGLNTVRLDRILP